MQISRLLRILLALGIGLAFILTLVGLLYLTQMAFAVWDALRDGPIWFSLLYAALLLVLTGAVGRWIWRLLRPPRDADAAGADAPPSPLSALSALFSREKLEERITQAEAGGLDASQARAELARLRTRKEAGRLYVSLFGEISSGKSSLIRALLPTAQVQVGARGGTTRTLQEYLWRSPAGDELVLVDVPGTNEVGLELDELARAEAQRAHVVLYVCDGDLTQTQFADLSELLALGKPCILVLNKTDRYSQAELELLKDRLRERLAGFPRASLVAVRSGGEREVLRVLPDGREELVVRSLPAQVDELALALQRGIDEDPELLEQLRDSAVFSLVESRLQAAEQAQRQERAEALVTEYSRKAVLGALAAVAPGSDLLIQGYLGVSLVKALSDLYQVPVHKADRDRLLSLVQKQVLKTLPITLAVAGNALKAFPGVGTVIGGLLHAVAYGLIFQTLGRALAQSFASRSALHPLQVARTFKETLGENLDLSAREMAALALRLARDKTGGRPAP